MPYKDENKLNYKLILYMLHGNVVDGGFVEVKDKDKSSSFLELSHSQMHATICGELHGSF